jgi:hypothetical protein
VITMSNRNHPSPVPSNRRPTDDSIRYRVRDADWGNVWGQDLTWDEAQRKLTEVTTLKKLTRTASIRPMSERPPDWWLEENAAATAAVDDGLAVPDASPPVSLPDTRAVGTLYKVASAMATTTIQSDGVVSEIPPGHQLLVNGQDRPVPTRVSKGDAVECRSLNPAAAAARAAGIGAAASVIQSKQRRPYFDVTVKKPAPRTAPPPRDRTMSNQPVTVRLGTPHETPPRPLPSPQKVAELEEGDIIPDGAISDADLPDLAVDLGGGASDADVAHARRQAEAEQSKVG